MITTGIGEDLPSVSSARTPLSENFVAFAIGGWHVTVSRLAT
jgi:hypothetical protein